MEDTGRRLTALEDDAKQMSKILVQLADNNGRFNLSEERQMAQGKRLDELTRRINDVLDTEYRHPK